MTEPVPSPAQDLARDLARCGPERAEAILDSLSVVEMAALAYDWSGTWARPQQIIDLESARSHGFLTGRRFGKTRSDIEAVSIEVAAGRAMRVGFCAQNLDKTLEVLVFGDCGFLAVSPPWFKARWELNRVIWPNGAQAFPFTPEVPGAIRGPGVHLFLASELQSWPIATAFEAWYNAMLMTSLGQARMLWEATPKRGNPLISMLLKRAADEPNLHRVTLGTLDDNRANLGDGVVEEMHRNLDGTQRGREELGGAWSESDDEALWQPSWIRDNRRPRPAQFARRVISLDPAIGTKEDSDSSGIADVGMDRAGQIFPVADLTGKYAGLALADLAIERYVSGRCDLILIETNRGGSWGVELLRAVADKHHVRIEVVAKDWRPHRTDGVVYVREINSKGSKGERAQPVATLAEQGRISHPEGTDLEALETLMTTWVPPPPGTRAGGRRSPDSLDAFVIAVTELAGLKADAKPDGKAVVRATTAALTKMAGGGAPRSGLAPSALARLRGPWRGGSL